MDDGLVPGGGSAVSENASDMEDGVVPRDGSAVSENPKSGRCRCAWWWFRCQRERFNCGTRPLCLVVVPLSARTL